MSLNKTDKILILVDWFPPGYRAGGPIQSCANVAFALKDHYGIFVLTTDTDFGVKEPYPEILGNHWTNNLDEMVHVFYAKKNDLSLQQIREVLLEVDADFVYLNHLFSPRFVIFPLWMKWKGIIKGKVVVCPRGALYDSALSIKRYKKLPFLKLIKWLGIHKMVRFQATSEREQEAILDYFPGSEVVMTDDFPNTLQPPLKLIRKEVGILKCIIIARIHPIKNLSFLLSVLSNVKVEILLTIIGPVEDADYWEKCKSQIKNLPANIKLDIKGALPNHELLPILQEHHLFILPTKGENFGHSIFESFLTGRPVLISDQTPWLKLNAIQAGWDLSLTREDAFVEAIETAANWNQTEFDKWCTSAWRYAKTFIENPALKQQYLQLFS